MVPLSLGGGAHPPGGRGCWRAGTGPSTGCAGSARTSRWSPPTSSPSATTCPAAYVEFVDRMLSATPFEVVAEFFPSFAALDKFDAVEALGEGADRDHLRHRRQAHLDRPQPQAARPHRRLDAAGVRGRRPHGDPRAPRPGQRRARPAARRGRGDRWTPGDAWRSAASAPRRPTAVLAVVRAAFEARPPLDPPAAALTETDRVARPSKLDAARRPARPPRRASTSARWCSTRSGSTMYLRRFGVLPGRAGPRRRRGADRRRGRGGRTAPTT